MKKSQEQLAVEVINMLRSQLEGLHKKIREDFSLDSYNSEQDLLSSDPIYNQFYLNSPEYVNIRLMGRVSISIGRRIGEIYDKVPRMLAINKYGIQSVDVTPKIGGLELDVCLRFSQLSQEDIKYLSDIHKKYLNEDINTDGFGIEIRYNFNPNDSSRLRKDCEMAKNLERENLTPIYLIFSSISPRNDAIKRLATAGWKFLIGQDANNFSKDIFGLDIGGIFQEPEIQKEIKQKINDIMNELKSSHAFKQM